MEISLGAFEVTQMSLTRRADGDAVSTTLVPPEATPGQAAPQVMLMNLPQGPTPRMADTVRLGKQFEIILRELT